MRSGAGTGRGGVGRGGFKKSKLISAPPHGAGLKSCLISTPLPLQGEANPRGAKQEGTG